MELCKTCTRIICHNNIITKEEENLRTIKCLEYKKDEGKIKGYEKPLIRTANQGRAIMNLGI